MQEIVEYLKEKAPLVDKLIEKYIPKSFDKDYIDWAFGKPQHSADIPTLNGALAEPIWDFLDRGGKKWRPALFLLISEALNADMEKVKDFSIVPEMTHNGSIMVDDIEDQGQIRRGKPCTHKLFGTDVAINAGNYMYVAPTLVFIKNRKNFDNETMLNAYDAFAQEMIKIHLGQAMDIWWHRGHTENLTEENYLQMCAYKTGTLARMAARLAVILAGGNRDQEEKIGKMANNIGIAFQIQDDILSASSDEFAAKKGHGDDITEGKRSLLVIRTLETASPEDAARLKEILDMHTREIGLINEALAILKKYGAIEYANTLAKKLVKEAWAQVEPLLKDSKAKELLRSFADFAIERKI